MENKIIKCPSCGGLGYFSYANYWSQPEEKEACSFCKETGSVEESVAANDQTFGYQPYTNRPHLCGKCSQIATWSYGPAPSPEEKDLSLRFLCDNCIHRGCSCNSMLRPEVTTIYKNDNGIISEDWFEGCYLANPESDFIIQKDHDGRELPCVDWNYIPFELDAIQP